MARILFSNELGLAVHHPGLFLFIYFYLNIQELNLPTEYYSFQRGFSGEFAITLNIF
jgi:hypothetical protein